MRGFLLPAVLLLGTLMLIMGMALMTSKTYQQRQLSESALGLQALELARAGLEDGRVKLLKDPKFPPPSIHGQNRFCYSQALDSSQGKRIGLFQVELDWSYDQSPYDVLKLRSTGWLGASPEQAQAQRTVEAAFRMETGGWTMIRYDEF